MFVLMLPVGAFRALLNCGAAVLLVLVHLCLGMTKIYPVVPLTVLGLW